MCGRYEPPRLDDSPEELYEMLLAMEKRLQSRSPDFSLKQGELFPGDTAPVIAPDKNRRRSMFPMKWGFFQSLPQTPALGVQLGMDSLLPDFPQEEMKGRLVFNARSESASTKPLFADSMRNRRCVIPASCYYEWDHRHNMEKYRFSMRNDPVMYLAGLYRVRDGAAEFTVLTREAAGGTEAFHDRMPVIAPHSLIGQWLDPSSPPKALLEESVTDLRW